jgi:hypothetical protein
MHLNVCACCGVNGALEWFVLVGHLHSFLPDSIPAISEEVAREALLREVSTHCCYGKGAAEGLVFTNMVPSSAFHVSSSCLSPLCNS